MKLKYLLLPLILSYSLFAQNYPEVSIKDIQFAPIDSLEKYGLLGSEPQPSYVGDTVTVTGVVMNPTYEGANPDSIESLHHGVPSIYLMDQNNPEWGGIIVRDVAGSSAFSILDSGLVIKVTGEVEEYFTTTELNISGFEASNVIGVQPRPKPVPLTLDSFVVRGTGNPIFTAEKWESVFVELENLTVINNQAIGSNSFIVGDENNSQMIVYTKSDYFRRRSAPLPGSKINRLAGFIETRTGVTNGWYLINPVFEEDLVYGESPPNISGVQRDKVIIRPGEEVEVTVQVTDNDKTAPVNEVNLFYSLNASDDFTKIAMTLADPVDSTWSAVIPGQEDMTLVAYYIQASDDKNFIASNPSNIVNDLYYYTVLSGDLTIKDIQYNPFNGGFSSFNGYEVTVSGVVTADTTDIEGDGSNIGPQVYMQDPDIEGAWSAIQLFGTEALNLRRGDDITVTGIVNESFGITRIEGLDSPEQIVAQLSGRPIPEATLISTADIGSTPNSTAEAYEGVLVKYENVTVINENADGNPGPDEGTGGNRNFGEMFVADTSNIQTRVEVQDGTHDYHNFWDPLFADQPLKISDGDTFDELHGILFFSFGNFKLVPRKNDDFVGFVTGVDDVKSIPASYSISQNYPNPFNPSTTIEYSLPEASYVKIDVFNILGQKISTLVNAYMESGNHKVNFTGNQFPSGVYFYKIEAGSEKTFVTVKKMMLLK